MYHVLEVEFRARIEGRYRFVVELMRDSEHVEKRRGVIVLGREIPITVLGIAIVYSGYELSTIPEGWGRLRGYDIFVAAGVKKDLVSYFTRKVEERGECVRAIGRLSA